MLEHNIATDILKSWTLLPNFELGLRLSRPFALNVNTA